MRSHLGQIGLLYGETMLLCSGITDLSKHSILRNRPYVFNKKLDIEYKQYKNARYSFFSAHTSTVAVNAFFTAKIITDFYPDSKLKPFIWGLAITLPALTGYFRVAGGAHYLSDVIVGYAVGASIGYFIPHFHKKKNANKELKNLSINTMGTGVRLALVF
jgi:membrane-associated phospholipid phosphatase